MKGITMDRVPDAAAGVSVLSAVAANFAADPISTVAGIMAIFAALVSVIGGCIRIYRDWKHIRGLKR